MGRDTECLILFSWFGVLWLSAGGWWWLGAESLIQGRLKPTIMSYEPLLITQDCLEIYHFFILNTICSLNSFFSSVITEQNNLDKFIRNSESLSIFKKSILNIRPSPNSTYNCFNIKGINYYKRLCLGSSLLCCHQFKHSFLDSLNAMCICGFDIELNCHSLIHCPSFINERSLLLNNTTRVTNG